MNIFLQIYMIHMVVITIAILFFLLFTYLQSSIEDGKFTEYLSAIINEALKLLPKPYRKPVFLSLIFFPFVTLPIAFYAIIFYTFITITINVYKSIIKVIDQN